MKLKQKQRLERNKITFILGLIILGLLNALTLLDLWMQQRINLLCWHAW